MRYIFVLFFLSHLGIVKAQSTDFLVVRGTVYDKASEEPVPYSHVTLKNRSIGTVVNEDGEFSFKIPMSSKTDTVSISAIGYTTQLIPVPSIESSFLEVILIPESKILEEVVVTDINPEVLLKEVIRKIPDNYGRNPTQLTGFYNESVKISDEYYSYLEGVISTYKTGYDKKSIKEDQVKVIKGRKRDGKLASDKTRQPPAVRAGPTAFNSYDFIKRRRNFLSNKKINLFHYELTDITNYNGMDVYIISFNPRKDSPKSFHQGRMYIETDSRAVIRIEFEMTPSGIDILNRKNVKNGKGSAFYVTATSMRAVLDYDLYGTEWALSQVRLSLGFDYLMEYTQTTEQMDLGLHIITTDLKKRNIQPFSKEDAFKSKQLFATSLGKDDPLFWENYNVLEQSNKLKAAFEGME
ncbi:carboxypeptidase-like regulatory domain-containing protein [Fulvivirga sp. M361]|uniref:carboxypeptidase-like regulatory domain-containing protein n=1 Tax=Fulvivirga sp. M361 TaxID=2594266 RepID=UPI00117BAA84|nr:carboxypeptidase-like regulatory domain-containing protein [Fulvivirga sp. M361]TRX61836.1 carboxypeptidase-like regulatory domain-containing protein [Fulvivirga sp. M361]